MRKQTINKSALEVDYKRNGDVSKQLPPRSERRQDLEGFEADYVDIVDFIVRGTHRIWEEGGLGIIYNNYQHDVKIWTSDGLAYGRDVVIANSAQTQSAFPDALLIADDVIWSGNDVDGFHTSHRIHWVAHNTGYTVYGPPTGRRIVRSGTGNCFIRANRIIEEWIARDEISLVHQLGYDPDEIAERYARRVHRGDLPKQPTGDANRIIGQTSPAALPPQLRDGFDPEDLVRRAIHEIWNWRLPNKIRDYYAASAVTHAADRRDLYGYGDLRQFVLSLIAAFPDAAMDVDHVYWLGNAQDGYRIAVRWAFHGHHRGHGIYGQPTGGPVRIIGITHFLVKDERIVEEWMMFDELSIFKQVWLARVANGG